MAQIYSYRVQIGCVNCRHVFVREEYDHGDELYCTLNAPPRPLCMSVYMGESGCSDGQGQEKWEEWSRLRNVLPHGICDLWANDGAAGRQIVTHENGVFVAQSMIVDVASDGKTEAEALANLSEAVDLYCEPSPATIEHLATICMAIKCYAADADFRREAETLLAEIPAAECERCIEIVREDQRTGDVLTQCIDQTTLNDRYTWLLERLR